MNKEETGNNFWGIKRRLIIVFVILSAVCLVGVYFYINRAMPVATCVDSIQNQNETGIDCGGVCQVSCKESYIPIEVKYARALKVKDNTYDLLAFIENKNISSEPKEVLYTMTAYTSSGAKVSETSGKTFLPVASSVPVIQQNITSTEPINKVLVTINSAVMYDKQDTLKSKIKVTSSFYNDIDKILNIKVKNTGDIDVRNVSVRAIITDNLDSAVAAGQRVISQIGRGEEKEISITWYNSLNLPNLRSSVYVVADPYYNN